MGTKFFVLCLSLSLVFSTFSQVSCQDETPSDLNVDQHLIDGTSEIQSGGQNNSNSVSLLGDVKTDEEDSSIPSQRHAELQDYVEAEYKLEDINESFLFLFNKTSEEDYINESFSSDGVCGSLNQECVINEKNVCSFEFEETNAEFSTTLTQLIEIYKETDLFGYEFRFNATEESRKSMEKLKITLTNLVANLSVDQLLIHPKFDLIADLITHLDVFNSSDYTSSFASLIKYRETILEGFEASIQIEESEFKANILKEIAIEKERIYDVKYNETKYYAEVVDQLKMRIMMINRLLMKLEKDRMEAKNVYASLQRNLMVFLSETTRAKEEYVVAARKLKEQIASATFAVKETRNAEITWAQLQRSFSN